MIKSDKANLLFETKAKLIWFADFCCTWY